MSYTRALGIVTIGALCTVGFQAQRADAALDYPDKAKTYSTRFVRAMDPCTSAPGITIVNPGNIKACAQANSTTDSAVTGMREAKLSVVSSRTGSTMKLRLRVIALEPAATSVGLRLTLRTSNTLGLPVNTVRTYEDQTVICGEVPGGLCGNATAPSASGKVSLRQDLSECLADNGLSNLVGRGNVEIVDAALINCNTGKVFAVPGVLQ